VAPVARAIDPKAKPRSFKQTVAQILVIDIVFSIDSVVTAVGMAQQLWVMVVAVMISVGIMLIFAGKISAYVEKHPTLKMLALSFLLLIGMVLVADGLGQHISKGYIYFAMAFSLAVEVLNLVAKGRSQRKAALEARGA
jgi:predicted tellurium resistance membrane protein TerC